MKNKFLLIPLLILSSCGGSTPSSEPIISSSELPSSEPTISSSEASSELSSSEERREIVIKEREKQYLDDNYGSFYQIFPYSFADSDRNGTGDIPGIIAKFDYLKNLNIGGLWLTPVHPSQSYHKYDVKNYYDIDENFGTIDDYDELVGLCHDNHMKIILDLVFNHSSNQHQWFHDCLNAHINGKVNNKYYNFYNVEEFEGNDKQIPDGWHRYGGSSYIYEGRFSPDMPDFNLQGVIDGTNTYLINEFKSIMSYWLIDHDVDGFRLDACTSFFTGDEQKNYEFLNWLKAEAVKIKPNAYIIGEVLEPSSTYRKYYSNTNVDSYFCFDDCAKYRNAIYNPVLQENATLVDSYFNRDIRQSNGHIAAPLLANHDIGRSYKKNFEANKLVHAFLSMGYGATYEYYGEEIGMANLVAKPEDLGFRLPLKWGDNYTCTNAVIKGFDQDEAYPLGSVKDQEADPDSLLNYYKKCYLYRLENPELARGSSELVYQSEDDATAVIKRSYNGSDVYIVINLSKTASYPVDVKDYKAEIVGDLSVLDSPYYSGDKLVMPPLSVLILH